MLFVDVRLKQKKKFVPNNVRTLKEFQSTDGITLIVNLISRNNAYCWCN